jgi:mono/diheme cytochrome c family protein
MNNKYYIGAFIAIMSSCIFVACSPAKGDSPGHEYMPDMGHSVAYEANRIDEYSLHTWNDQSVRTVTQLWGTPRKPVKGSIARGYVGLSAHTDNVDYAAQIHGMGKGVSTPVNGSVPYYYADTEEERTRANKEIVGNPYPITKIRLEKGKELWKVYCGICHGDKCGGNGYLVREDGKYPAQPANLLLDTFANGNNGRLYHAIMYGKNVMGNYADKLSYEERWNVIHYIRSCQAEEKKVLYNETQNTLKLIVGIPDSLYKAMVAKKAPAVKVTSEKKPADAHGETPHTEVGASGGHSRRR